MRIPSDLSADPSPRRRHRARWWIIAFVVLIVILLVSLRSLAGIYTDSLWFSSVGYHNVFSTLLVTKLGLFGVFGAIFFAILWINLVVCDRIAGHDIVLAQEDELVRRYQHYVRPYAGRIYVALAFVLALIGASGTIGQWNNWILFRHGGSFGISDPQFHKDVGFYVFKLPFLTFVVDWTLAILIVTLAVTLVFHYFNGGIQPQRGLPRVRPPVKAHISVLLALIALDKAAGYVLQRWSLVNAQDAYVNGAGYTDVHARLPAELLLVYVSIFAAAILLFNIRRQGWTLPVLAVGIWAFVALVVGIIYPALLQALKVTPAQSSLEAPYIQRNITATRQAYNLTNVRVSQFPANTTINESQTFMASGTIANIRQWDPDDSISLQTFQRLQGIKSYYLFPTLGVDRYDVAGKITPVLIGVRQISSANVPSQSWVNTHLQYTHGNGAAVAVSNQTVSKNPDFAVSQVPPTSSQGIPKITQPNVYFALGETGYVVANTRQAEVDYQNGGTSVESHYKGGGGVQLSSLFTRAAFALRLGDLNLLISSQITDKSRLMFVRDPVAMAQKAAPFLSFDHDPYAVINDSPGPDKGHIDWVVDGYTTTANYPYSQNADTQQVAIGSTLPGSYNYVRNSVKVIVDAYTGQMTFYDMDPRDPILQAYSAAFPGMFQPLGTMSKQLRAHLRYPPDIFSIQSAIYGRYHLTNPQNFYAASNAWQLSPTAGAGPQSQALLAENTYNNQGQLISTTPARMAPQYQVYALPGTTNQQFTVSDGFVPASQSTGSGSNQNFNLTAWMVGLSDPSDYGQLNLYEVPQGTLGPANADAEIEANQEVSSEITLLNQHGSQVLLGETLMVPISNSMVYIRPLYTAASTNPQPQLTYIIAVLGKNVGFEKTLSGALSDVLNATVTIPSGGSSSGTVPAAVAGILQQAQQDYTNAQAALAQQDLATYQADIAAMEQALQQAEQIIGPAPAGTSSGTTTTTTTVPKAKAKAKSSGAGTSGTNGSGTSTTASTAATTSSTTTTTQPSGGGTTTSTNPLISAAAKP
ncbi:MAG TPA: UPF0182 family protein [Acidimicrobiales bacterium]|nr:UPF0182 family protein [Acidimicrobiales bacterium]